jgi:protein SCO1/2
MPTRARTLTLALAAAAALAVVLVAILTGAGKTATRTSSDSLAVSSGSGFDGAALGHGIAARPFTLSDQHGRPVSLSDYRGQVVLLTFLYSTCGATCILIAQQLRGALDELAHPVPVLIVSANPAADTPAHVRSFLSEVSLTGRAEYLTGPLARLRPIWAAYGVKPASVGASRFDEYASVLLLDRSGEERVLFQTEQLSPESLAHDIRKLGGDPTDP